MNSCNVQNVIQSYYCMYTKFEFTDILKYVCSSYMFICKNNKCIYSYFNGDEIYPSGHWCGYAPTSGHVTAVCQQLYKALRFFVMCVYYSMYGVFIS